MAHSTKYQVWLLTASLEEKAELMAELARRLRTARAPKTASGLELQRLRLVEAISQLRATYL